MIRNLAASPLTAFCAALTLALLPSTKGDFQPFGYDTPSYIDFQDYSYSVKEDQTNLVLTVIRQGDYRRMASVDYELAEGSAVAGEDFAAAGGTIVFRAGETRKEISVSIIQDSERETNEAFYIQLSTTAPYTEVIRPSVNVQIEDVPQAIEPPRLAITPAGEGKINLSWESSVAECVLERALSTSNEKWEVVSDLPQLVGDKWVVTQSVTGPHYFYRLLASPN